MARLTGPDIQVTDGTGVEVVASGNVYFSDPGTTNEKTVYSDSGLATPISQPITLNSEGRFSTDVYGDGAFRVECYDSTDTGSRDGVQVFDVDNVRGPSDLSTITATAPIKADDSTSTASPVYTFDGDTDTGIAHPAANTLAGVTGGTERWRTNSSGDTGFGTSSPLAIIHAIGSIIATRGIRSGSYEYTDGTETVLTISSDNVLYLFWSEPANFGGSDDRHGTLALVQAARSGSPAVTEIVSGMSGGTGTFSISGSDVQYAAGGGTPTTTIYWLRLF